MQPGEINIFMLVALTGLVLVAGMLTACKRNGRVTNDAAMHFKQMKPDDDLMPRLPPTPTPDIVLEVTKDGYFIDGREIHKPSLRDEFVRAVGQGRKVIEIRGSDSISNERIEYVFDTLDRVGFEQILLTSTDAKIQNGEDNKRKRGE